MLTNLETILLGVLVDDLIDIDDDDDCIFELWSTAHSGRER